MLDILIILQNKRKEYYRGEKNESIENKHSHQKIQLFFEGIVNSSG
jgi:hypothetical protein